LWQEVVVEVDLGVSMVSVVEVAVQAVLLKVLAV
jgi:hypothetical protein